MFLNLLEEMDVMELDLALRLPKPKKINPPDDGDDDAGVKSIAKSHVTRSVDAPILRAIPIDVSP